MRKVVSLKKKKKKKRNSFQAFTRHFHRRYVIPRIDLKFVPFPWTRSPKDIARTPGDNFFLNFSTNFPRLWPHVPRGIIRDSLR